MGFNVEEVDFGDILFTRESSGNTFEQKQFIHIPNVSDAKKQILEAGFEMIEARRTYEIASKDFKDRDNVYNRAPMFYVCRKGEKKSFLISK